MATLTAKQEMFVKEYLIDLNATQAAIRAGYSEKTANEQASRLLANVNIQEVVQNSMNDRAYKTELTAEWVLNNLKEVAERCMQAEPVLDREGNETGEWRFEHAGANKSLELIGKHLKLFTDKVEHSGDISINLEGEVKQWAK